MERKTSTEAQPRATTPSIAILAVILASGAASSPAQDYRSSVVGTDFDFILETDPSTFLCLEFKGRGLREMPDKTRSSGLIQDAFIFVSYFADGTSIDMAIDVDFETEDAARREAARYVPRLGKLPTSLRRGIERMVVHKGEENATAFSDVGLVVVYSDNATKRISTHDLEETIFHESVHASWDKRHASSPEWRRAQDADGTFVTDYARKKPDGEDLAESALFAYTLLHRPERIPEPDAARIRSAIPARIAFVRTLLPPGEPVVYQVGPRYACDGSGTTFTVSDERMQAQDGKGCQVEIGTALSVADILSNALMRGLDVEETRVSSFLRVAKKRYATADQLLDATGAEFGFDRATLDAEVQEFLHCNCDHDVDETPMRLEPSPTAPDSDETAVTLMPKGPAEPASDRQVPAELRWLLYLIALVLVLLLAVNATTLAVLVRRDKVGPATR